MTKSIAQFTEERRKKEEEMEVGTVMVVDGHPFIYLSNGKRPYFKEKDSQIVIM